LQTKAPLCSYPALPADRPMSLVEMYEDTAHRLHLQDFTARILTADAYNPENPATSVWRVTTFNATMTMTDLSGFTLDKFKESVSASANNIPVSDISIVIYPSIKATMGFADTVSEANAI